MNAQTAPNGRSSEHSPTPPMPAGKKAIFALGDHTINISLSSLSLVFFFFLTKVAGLEPWLAGVLAWTARVIDAVSDPLMGRISDTTRWKMGRRRPYFLIGAIPFGLCFSLLWTTPFEGQAAMFAYYVTIYIGLCLSMTVLSVPYMALIPEMTSDYDERTSLNTFRSAAAVVGTMVAASFITVSGMLGEGAAGFARTGFAIALWLMIVWPFVFKVSYEPGVRNIEQTMGLVEGIRSLAHHATYIKLCVIYLTARISVDVLGLTVPLFLSDWIGRREDIAWTLWSMLGVVILSLPFWLRAARRMDKHRIFVIGATWFVVCLIAMCFGDAGWPRWTVFALAGLMGVGYAVADLMPWAMLGEVIDEDELISGERREGVYNGVFTFLRKMGGATAYMLAGFVLSAAGYSKGAVQPDSALTTIRFITTLVPAAFLCISIAVAIRYPLGRARHAEILREIEQRRPANHST